MPRLFSSMICLAAFAAVNAFIVPTGPMSGADLMKKTRTAAGVAAWGVASSPMRRLCTPLKMVSHPEVDNEYKRKLSEQRRWTKSTKQIATLGPVSCTEEMIEKLFLAGADVFRLNFSHGAHEEKAALLKIIRNLEAKYTHPIAILADLQGPKLRVGTFEHDKVCM